MATQQRMDELLGPISPITRVGNPAPPTKEPTFGGSVSFAADDGVENMGGFTAQSRPAAARRALGERVRARSL